MKRWLIFLMSLTLTVAVAGGVVAGFTVGDDGSNPPTEDPTGPTNTSEGGPADGWHFVQATGWSGGFSLWLPPGWQLNELQGIDSYVGEIVGDGVRLTFDFGWYSNPLADEGDPLHVVTREEIGGRLAKLVRPKEGTEGAVTGVYFENFDIDEDAAPWGRERLQVNGLGLTLEQQETALVIFRSIRLLASDDQHPIRSDEGIDPDECNWVHNIDACKKGDIPEDGDVVAINPDYSADTPVSNDGVPKPVEGVPDHDYDSGDSSGFKGRPQRLDERCQL